MDPPPQVTEAADNADQLAEQPSPAAAFGTSFNSSNEDSRVHRTAMIEVTPQELMGMESMAAARRKGMAAAEKAGMVTIKF